MERDLRLALERNQLELYYQPLVRVADRRMVGVEALVRWHHPELGRVAPEQFIPLAEESGLIGDIGRWVLESACGQAAAWQRDGLHLIVNVNLSSRQLKLGLGVDDVKAVLHSAGLAAQQLHLEITESLMMEDTPETLDWVEGVRALGVSLAVDDFGTGYSSLSYLKRFPMRTLKIDREFVTELPGNPNDASLVHAIMAMAESLDLEVVAEGVETLEQFDFLRAAGCDIVQGNYFSRPMPAARVPFFAQSHHQQPEPPGEH